MPDYPGFDIPSYVTGPLGPFHSNDGLTTSSTISQHSGRHNHEALPVLWGVGVAAWCIFLTITIVVARSSR